MSARDLINRLYEREQPLYHVAHQSDLKSILTQGLLAVPDYILTGDDDRPGVNLTTDPEMVPWYNPKKYVIIQVNRSKLNKNKLLQFGIIGDADGDWWYRYLDNIPAAALIKGQSTKHEIIVAQIRRVSPQSPTQVSSRYR